MTARRFICLFCSWTFIFLLLTACAANPNSTATPIEKTALATESVAPTTIPPQVSAETGAIKVTLISTVTNKPLADALIRGATLLKMQGSLDGVYVPSLDSKASPWGVTDAEGKVVFSNVKPGKYSLAYIFPIGMPELVREDGSDKDFVVDVEAGKVSDLGTLKVTINPDKLQ